jgi:hypothetical protein
MYASLEQFVFERLRPAKTMKKIFVGIEQGNAVSKRNCSGLFYN